MSPPGLTATTPHYSVGFIASDTLIKDLHRLMAHHGIVIGPRKVHRLVRDFVTLVRKMTVRGDVGQLFGDYLEHRLDLSQAKREELTSDPTYYSVIQYRDPTGADAVANVMDGGDRGHH